jgi:uncharacterized protein (UPF0332 family)
VTEEGTAELIAEELRCADEELRGAEALLDASLPRIALTRVYFAVFHAVRALLLRSGVEPRSHRALVNLFGLHFVRSARYPPESGRFVTRLQRYREEADYGIATWADAATARAELAEARALVARIASELAGPG